jgi:peptide deformylase
MSLLPYVTINGSDNTKKEILRTSAQPVIFPLSDEDYFIIESLVAKFDAEGNCAGLAAPQIGFSKRVIVFAVPDNPDLRKWRKDIIETMPKTVWVNPEYSPIGTKTSIDFEACFSVEGLAAAVERFTTISYTAYTPDGHHVTGTANGFLARLIQHEIDHLNGILFIDKVKEEDVMTTETYRKLRSEAIT